MSKLLNNYVKLKSKNSSKIYLFKSGIFYIFLDEDAKLMSQVLNLKLTNLNENTVKCGFPTSSLDKYLHFLSALSFDIEIIDSQSFEKPCNELIKNFIFDISKINSEELSIKEAYSTIEKIVNQSKDLIQKGVIIWTTKIKHQT